MSCCNMRLKTSDLIDLNDIQDFCKFNEQTETFLNLNNKDNGFVDCCNPNKYIIRYELLNDLKVILTFEDTETGNVHFIETELANEDESIEVLFKRLIQVNEIIQDERLDVNFRTLKLALGEDYPSPVRLQDSNMSRVIYTTKEQHVTLFTFNYKVESVDEQDLQSLSKIEYNNFIKEIGKVETLNILRTLTKDLRFAPYEMYFEGTTDKSFTIRMFKNLNDNFRLLLDIHYVNSSDVNWGIELSKSLLKCNK